MERVCNSHSHCRRKLTVVPSWLAGTQCSTLPRSPCYVDLAEGWHEEEDEKPASEVLRYTSIIRWYSPTARADWYSDLYGASYWIFGPTLDSLKLGSAKGVDVKLLSLQQEFRDLLALSLTSVT